MKNVFKCKQNFESKVRKTGHCSYHIHKENLEANQSALEHLSRGHSRAKKNFGLATKHKEYAGGMALHEWRTTSKK